MVKIIGKFMATGFIPKFIENNSRGKGYKSSTRTLYE